MRTVQPRKTWKHPRIPKANINTNYARRFGSVRRKPKYKAKIKQKRIRGLIYSLY